MEGYVGWPLLALAIALFMLFLSHVGIPPFVLYLSTVLGVIAFVFIMLSLFRR